MLHFGRFAIFGTPVRCVADDYVPRNARIYAGRQSEKNQRIYQMVHVDGANRVLSGPAQADIIRFFSVSHADYRFGKNTVRHTKQKYAFDLEKNKKIAPQSVRGNDGRFFRRHVFGLLGRFRYMRYGNIDGQIFVFNR